MTHEFAILAGESSGDAFGARLASEIWSLDQHARIWGLGGSRMRAAGVEVVQDIHGWATIGIVQSLRVAPRLRFRVYPRLLAQLQSRKPSVVVPVDFGAFNVPVARWCKAHGLKVLYFLPPGSWRKSGPLPTNLAAVTDHIATQFPWSAERLRQAGAKADFVGHPLLDIVNPSTNRDRFMAALGLSADRPVIAMLPGSREGELAHNSPAMADAARLLSSRMPSIQFVVALAGSEPSVMRGLEGVPTSFAELAQETGPDGARRAAIVRSMTHDALAHSDAGIVCSGTATLEAAILGMPMVIIYRGSGLMRVEYAIRRISRIEHVGLPNIIAGQRIVPELIADAATPDAMAASVLRFLEDPEYAAGTRRALREVRASLGDPGACSRTARLAVELADRG
jgi:lipid-A-disaccharide synthase